METETNFQVTPDVILADQVSAEDPSIFRHLNLQVAGQAVGVLIAIEPVLLAAANALAEAIGRRLGEAVGDKLATALLGADREDSFKTEVLSRLDRIEKKIDVIVRFLTTELAALIRTEFRQEIVNDRVDALRSKLIRVESGLAKFRLDRSVEAASSLRESADNALEQGFTILQKGMEWHVAGLHAMASALSAYSLLIKFDKRNTEPLAVFARRYARLIEKWIDPESSGSFTTFKAQTEPQFKASKEAMDSPPTTNFIIQFVGPDPLIPLNGTPAQLAQWLANSAVLLQFDSNGNWFGGGIDRAARVTQTPIGQIPTAEQFGLPALPWWRPVVSGPRDADTVDVFNRMLATASAHMHNVLKLPGQIAECDVAISTIQRLLDCCNELAKLKSSLPRQ
jgi:hypothetical protein